MSNNPVMLDDQIMIGSGSEDRFVRTSPTTASDSLLQLRQSKEHGDLEDQAGSEMTENGPMGDWFDGIYPGNSL
jgi:hypothetical protein